ncbi:MAG: c-type cytochrome [Pirellulales bacterium]|nr:c-type cytochrome [Pirellulales bacterium]
MRRLRLIIWGSLLLFPLTAGSSVSADESQSLVMLTETLNQVDDSQVRAALMRGMINGLAGRRDLAAPKGWQPLAAKLAKSDSEEVRELAMQLSQIFGDQQAIARALATVGDQNAPAAARRRALRTLLNQQNDQVSNILESLLDEPELRRDAIRGYAAVENPRAPDVLLGRYESLSPPNRRAVVETLATRKRYAEALLKALTGKAVDRQDIPVHVARSLEILLGDKFVKVFGEVRSLAADREKMMTKYKKMITPETLAEADASRGRAVFQKTCASCHLLYGTGGKIGPDLTGSNRANLDYILLNSVDPSYDVPDGYKMVLIQTVDGRLINGVVAEEDNQRVVLKTVEQPTVIIAKVDIENRKVSAKSMMPDGQLDQMTPQQVIDLIKYLRTTEQVELP